MDERQRLRVVIGGAVQGVGFRPFIYRLATDLGLDGWVINGNQGVAIEVEGAPERLRDFLTRVESERPPRAVIQSLESVVLDPVGLAGFAIRPSDDDGPRMALVLPDIATCPDCLAEVLDPADRRHRYPFTNCTNCGPRYSIIQALPYDRPRTTMRAFPMCPACLAEYENPRDRRFHAQPNACPRCGPWLELWAPDGAVLATHDAALGAAGAALRAGQIVAVKGLGGFHLMVDASDEAAVRRLRQVKAREEKPFALLYPSLERAAADAEISPLEARLLRSPEAPIVLLQRRATAGVAPGVAPATATLGIMLPATPLHHLLLAEAGRPLVATSGNRADEPLQADERTALTALAGLTDLFLVHNRPIARHVDDSIVRVVLDRELILRRARGYAPLPVTRAGSLPPLLAVGAHQKNAIAVTAGSRVILSQHIGDLDTAATLDAFRAVTIALTTLYDVQPVAIACDTHPDYQSTRHAEATGLPLTRVQHHYAHILSAMADNELHPPVLGVAWDGTGAGDDGTIWGGEFLRVGATDYERVACVRPFRLPGGEAAVREPRRVALGLLHVLFGDGAFDLDSAPARSFSQAELTVLRTMLARGARSPLTSSAGRLFDGVAALLGLVQCARHEGQAAQMLEHAATPAPAGAGAYPLPLAPGAAPAGPRWLDWASLVLALLDDLRRETPAPVMAARFHNALAEGIVTVATWVGEERVALSGGCFQNATLTERAVTRLRAAGFRPYWHQRVPPNDGGIAVGQAMAVGRARGIIHHEG